MIHQKLFALVCALCLSWAVASYAAAQSASRKKSTAKTAAKKSLAKTSAKSATKKGGSKLASSKKSSKKKSKTVARASWRNTQRTPTPERYKEIQQALASKGYLQGEADGVWTPQSIDALKRFQQDQNLDPNGRITSLSLIALGLGPKYDRVEPSSSIQ